MNQDSDKPNPMRLYGAGAVFIAMFMLPLWLGYWLDLKLNSRPRLMILGGIIGFIVGLRRLIKDTRPFTKTPSAVNDNDDADRTCDKQ